MMFVSNTRNQHFLSQSEQRLNALNPGAKARHQRIYEFEVVDRDNYVIKLQHERGSSIARNLAFEDLFSFDTLEDQRLRLNFESVFNRYEDGICAWTDSILTKVKSNNNDIGQELVKIFATKLLNFARNPYCIQKVLNTFPLLGLMVPTDPVLFENCNRVANGRKPHQARLCSDLAISDAQYVEWLRLLYMLLVPMAGGSFIMLDDIVKGLFEDRKTHVAVVINEYDSEKCLLSDRSWCQPIEQSQHLALSFNLRSNAFIDYVFVDPRSLLDGKASPEFLSAAIAHWEALPEKTVNVTYQRNDISMLLRYNRRVVDQCHKSVFCSSKKGIII